MAEYSDEQFLEYVVKAIVDNPDDVNINRQIDEMGVLLTLKVSPKDMGQVVGRQGATAKAIRSLLKIVGIKNNARVNLKIEEPEGGRRFVKDAPAEEPNKSSGFDGTMVGKVIDDIKKDL